MIKHVMVKGVRYNIKIESKLSGDDDDLEYSGECDTEKKNITLVKGDHRTMYNTLVHEMIHAALHETNVSRHIRGMLEEMIADNVADVLYDEFFSSKGVKKWGEDD